MLATNSQRNFRVFHINLANLVRFLAGVRIEPNYFNYVHGNCAQKGRKNIIWVRKCKEKKIHQQAYSRETSKPNFSFHVSLFRVHTNATGEEVCT